MTHLRCQACNHIDTDWDNIDTAPATRDEPAEGQAVCKCGSTDLVLSSGPCATEGCGSENQCDDYCAECFAAELRTEDVGYYTIEEFIAEFIHRDWVAIPEVAAVIQWVRDSKRNAA